MERRARLGCSPTLGMLIMTITEAIAYLENYQKWRSEDDERTMNEAGLTPKGITEAIDVVLEFVKEQA